jgi:UDP-perosamine 4-acetyltransferase
VPVPVVGLGAGGHAKVVIEILQLGTEYQVIGLLDPRAELHGKTILGVPVLGDDDLLPRLISEKIEYFFVGLGSASDLKPRRSLYETALKKGMKPVTAIHPSAIISASAILGTGAMIMAAAVLCASAELGENVIVNTSAVVEHDCLVGNHVHIATGALLAGGVMIGDGVHIGAGAVVRQYLRVGAGAVIGAGAVVVKNVPENHTMVGNPARFLEK